MSGCRTAEASAGKQGGLDAAVRSAWQPLDLSGLSFHRRRGADPGALHGPYSADGLSELAASFPEFLPRVRAPLPAKPLSEPPWS